MTAALHQLFVLFDFRSYYSLLKRKPSRPRTFRKRLHGPQVAVSAAVKCRFFNSQLHRRGCNRLSRRARFFKTGLALRGAGGGGCKRARRTIVNNLRRQKSVRAEYGQARSLACADDPRPNAAMSPFSVLCF